MRKRLLVLALLAVGAAHAHVQLAAAQSTTSPSPSSTEALPSELTEARVKRYIDAQSEIDEVLGDEAPEAGEPPDPKFVGRLEAIARKFKFANYADYDAVAGDIQKVLDGVDPLTKTYVGEDALINRKIAAAKADPKLPEEDRKATLSELEDELRAVTPIKFPGNIALVLKYYDDLNESDSGGFK